MFAINKHNIQLTMGITRMIDIPYFFTIDTSANCNITHSHQILTTKTCFLKRFCWQRFANVLNDKFITFAYLLDNEALALIVRSTNTYFFMTSIDYLLCWTVGFFDNKEEYIQHPGKVGLSLLELVPLGLLSSLRPAILLLPSS